MLKNKKKLSLYKKLLITYSIILLMLATVFLIYVNRILIEYENSDISVYLTNFIKEIKEDDLTSYLSNNGDSVYEKNPKPIGKAYKELLNSGKINIAKASHDQESSIYDICIEERKIYTIEVEKGESFSKLGILNYHKWNVKSITNYFDRGIYYYDVFVPDNFEVLINGNPISASDTKEEIKLADVKDAYNYISAPIIKKYEINNLTSKPTVIIKNNFNEEINYSINNNIIDATAGFKVVDSIEKVNEYYGTSLNPLEFAKKWSLFMTEDLSGPYRGFNTIKTYFIKDSEKYIGAHEWSRGVDITWTSPHYLKNSVFTNEKVTNCIIYSDNMFSCDVSLEKNMVVSGKDKTDVINEKIYYINYENEWKVIGMTTIIRSK
ncbi:MAG: hypothetical protein PHS45_00155 [Bacilli bacterium]|nr:hypothetical protein [Bacilli bacterium]